MKNFAKLAAIALVAAFVVVGSSASALTSAEIQAFLAQLSPAQLSAIMGTTATTANTASYTFTRDLTVGSTGADVTALQNFLIGKGFNTKATGYFGAMTKAALASYQSSQSIAPAAGYFGSKTRASVNQASVTSTSTSTTTTTTTTTGTTGISTPGAEGILTVTQGPLSSSVVNVGATKAPVLVIRSQAQSSDISISRIRLDLGSSTSIYNKVYQTLYVMDGSNVLATVALNNSTVVQSGSDYIVNITGLNVVVPKGAYKDLTIAADVYPTINSNYQGQPWKIALDGTDAVRGTDGAGIDQYGGDSSIAQTITLNSSLTDNAQVNVSLDPSSPLANSYPVTDTTNNQYLGLPIMTFDLYAQNDSINVRGIQFNISSTGPGKVTAAYLYKGSSPVFSTAVSGGVANFNNILMGQMTAGVNTNTSYTLKVDVSSVTGATTINASTTGALISAQNSQGESLTSGNVTGSAIANLATVVGTGPMFTLSGSPVITSQNITAGGATSTTYKYTATFNVNVTAVGSDLAFGLVGTSTQSFGTTTDRAEVYTNGSPDANTTAGMLVSYSQPSNTVISADGKAFTVSRGNTALIPVTYSFTVTNPGANTYAVQLQGINSSTGVTAFMLNQPAWRTTSI